MVSLHSSTNETQHLMSIIGRFLFYTVQIADLQEKLGKLHNKLVFVGVSVISQTLGDSVGIAWETSETGDVDLCEKVKASLSSLNTLKRDPGQLLQSCKALLLSANTQLSESSTHNEDDGGTGRG